MAKVLAGFSSFLPRTQRLGLSASALYPGGNQQKQKISFLLPQGSTETGSRRHLKRVLGSCRSWPEHRVEKRCPRTLATAIGHWSLREVRGPLLAPLQITPSGSA